MSDQLLSVKYCSLGLSSNIIREASNLLSAVLIDDSKIENNLDIVKEAIKLDKKMTKIRKTIYHRSANLNKYINFLIDKFSDKNLSEEELMEEARVSSFTSRLTEIQSIAAMNMLLADILNFKEDDSKRSKFYKLTDIKKRLEKLKTLLNKEQKYVTETKLRFEALKDFVWVFNFNKELTDLILLETKEEKIIKFYPNEMKDEFEKIEQLEIEAKKSLPIKNISINLEIYEIYCKIINKNLDLSKEQKKSLIYGFVNCLIQLAKFSEATKLINEHKKELRLDNDAQFWYLIGSIEMKKNFEYKNALQFMNEAKRLDFKNENINKEIRKLDKLERGLGSVDYINSLNSIEQPYNSVTSISNPKRKMDKKYMILSVDGGGIRGIIPAIWLREIEIATRKPISSLFNMMAGTSTGALITSALSLPRKLGERMPLYSAGTVVELYYYKSQSIFQNNGRESLFQKYFKNYKIEDSLTDLIIPTVQEENRQKTFLYSTFDANKHKKYNYSFYDMLMSTSSAPTYFDMHHVKKNNLGYTVDGGLTMNNPVEAAYFAAKENYGEKINGNVTVLSLGTGNYIPEPSYADGMFKGAKKYIPKYLKDCLFWAKNLKDYVLPPIEGDIENRMELTLGDKFLRWQVFTEKEMKMDDCDEENLQNLIEVARQKLEDLKEDDNNSFNKFIEILIDE